MNSLVVVTGAGGALGRSVVSALLADVATVVALDREGAALDAVADRDRVHPIAVDLADREAVRTAWSDIDVAGRPRALVALAGAFRPGAFADLDEGTLDAMWRANVVSVIWPAQEAVRRMADDGGVIVTVGSKTAVGGGGPLAHATSKAAVVRASELLAEELRGSRIRVNTVLPSVLDTPDNRAWMSADLADRSVDPAAVANVIRFLCSPDAWPISGARIPVYGDA